MQKGGALETDIHERRLHSGEDTRHASLVEIAHEAAPTRALDVNLLHDAVLGDRRACLTRRNVDQYLYAQIRAPTRTRMSQHSTNASPRRAMCSPNKLHQRRVEVPRSRIAATPSRQNNFH